MAGDTASANLSSVGQLFQKDGPLKQCREILEELNAKLKPGEGENKMRQFGARVLKWLFSSKDVEGLLKVIGKHKDTFNLALTGDNMQDFGLNYDYTTDFWSSVLYLEASKTV